MTRTLFILCTLVAVFAAIGVMRASDAAERADLAAQDLADCRAFLANPSRLAAAAELGLFASDPATAGPGAAPPAADAAIVGSGDLQSRIRLACQAAGVSERLTHIEAGDPGAPGGGDREAVLYLHFDGLTLEELTRFLHHLAASNRSARTRMIELSPPEDSRAADSSAADSPAGGGTSPTEAERWSTDITLAYRVTSAAPGTASHRP